jgi:hypothetical protein
LIGRYRGRRVCRQKCVGQLAVLRGWLVDRGLASDTPAEGLVLRDPLVLWEGSAFGSFRQMREFLVELEIGLSRTTGEMDLPDYVMQGVQRWRSALTRFFLSQAVNSGWNDLPVQAGDAEAGLEALYAERGDTARPSRIYRGGAGPMRMRAWGSCWACWKAKLRARRPPT